MSVSYYIDDTLFKKQSFNITLFLFKHNSGPSNKMNEGIFYFLVMALFKKKGILQKSFQTYIAPIYPLWPVPFVPKG